MSCTAAYQKTCYKINKHYFYGHVQTAQCKHRCKQSWRNYLRKMSEQCIALQVAQKLLEQKRLRNITEFQVFLENDSVRKTVERSECCGCFLKQKQASTSQKTKHSVAILKLASKLCCFVKDEV